MPLPKIPCVKCGVSIDARRREGLCPTCIRKPCTECGTPTGPYNKTGRCAKCQIAFVNSSPEIAERRTSAIRHKYATDPLFAARMKEHGRRFGLRFANDPELRERRVTWGKQVYREVLSRPDVVEKMKRGQKERSGITQRNRKLAWCPEEYRDEYLRLLRKSKLPKAEAQKIILDQIAADKARDRLNLSPFERQMRNLEKNPDALVANDQRPSLANPANYGEERWIA